MKKKTITEFRRSLRVASRTLNRVADAKRERDNALYRLRRAMNATAEDITDEPTKEFIVKMRNAIIADMSGDTSHGLYAKLHTLCVFMDVL